ncbi:MAG: M48 family metallopeptidase [Candidatus Binatia bacterium]
MVFPGYFTDGCTAERHTVNVMLEAHQLHILDERGVLRDEWSLSGLQLANSAHRAQTTRVIHRERPSACLILADPRALTLLIAAVPHLCRRRTARRSTATLLAVWGAAIVIIVAVVCLGVPRLADPLARSIPLQWEASLGRHVTSTFTHHTNVCRNQPGEAALRTLTERLAATLPAPFPVTVHVSRIPAVNAFALPGGHVVVFQELIESAQSPEEVAGVLAHEMAHQVQRHPLRGVIRSMGLHVVSAAVVGGFSLAAFSGAYVGETMLGLSFSREDESEADRIGVGMLNRANIRADGLIAFFQRYQVTNRSAASGPESTEDHLLTFLSTHPPGQTRIAAIRAMMQGEGDAMTADQWRALQKICGTEPPQKW